MLVKDVMTSNPACAVPETALAEIGQMMIDYDCGEIPVVDDLDSMRPVGVVTDRDIVVRTIGRGIDPMDLAVGEIMSTPVVTIGCDAGFEECCRLMEEKQIRRVPVVNEHGQIRGIVALADIARYADKTNAGEVVQEVSVEIGAPSNVV